MFDPYARLAERALRDEPPSEREALWILDGEDVELLPLLHAAFLPRRKHFGRRVMVHVLDNAQNGLCPEDCGYCSQSRRSEAPLRKYPLKSEAEILAGAERAARAGATRYCIVLSGRGPTLERAHELAAIVRRIKERFPIGVCLSVGLLEEEHARILAEAGLDRLNHNLNTSESHYPEICTTHTYADRVRTLAAARKCGIEPCSGLIAGMGERSRDLVEVAFHLRELEIPSIPVNFLIPIAGNPILADGSLTPERCLRVLALSRLVNPRAEVRIAAGREGHLRALGALALWPANSLFVEGYLTTRGDAVAETYRAIRDAGFEVDGNPLTDAEGIAGDDALPGGFRLSGSGGEILRPEVLGAGRARKRPPGSTGHQRADQGRGLSVDAIAGEVLGALCARDTHRRMRILAGAQAPRMRVDGREVLLFAGSNTLDLAHHPQVVAAAERAARELGCASGGSRLITGNLELHEALEAELASFLGREAALAFATGYMANVGVITSLVGPDDAVLSDALAHASIVDGCRLARARVRVLPHGDLDALEDGLRELASPRRRVLVAVDGVYSMDGDTAPLGEIVPLVRRYGATLLVDDAHGTGTLGTLGRGTPELFGVAAEVDVWTGTLGKALGSFGAFAAGSRPLRELLVNVARSFIFTCALPPPQVAAARAGLRLVAEEPWRRVRLQRLASRLRGRLAAHGISTAPSSTHIVPVVVGESAPTMTLCERLLARGFFTQGIRYPSVPDGTARLRITPMATHGEAEVDALADAIAAELPRLGDPSELPRLDGPSARG